jgi:hypothetical protein
MSVLQSVENANEAFGNKTYLCTPLVRKENKRVLEMYYCVRIPFWTSNNEQIHSQL